MRQIACLAAAIAASLALPQVAAAQDQSFDLGLGASYAPIYPGADESDASPWIIVRRTPGASTQGFRITPSLKLVGDRDPSDSPDLAGTQEIDRAVEVGAKVSYGLGAVSTYGALRKGIGGHDGLVGEVGAKYRTDVNDRLTLWSGLEAGYADSDYTDTYFGLPGSYSPGGGLKSVSAKVEARYALGENTALLGEVKFGRLVGDAADSPLVQDRDQTAIRLGIVRSFSFGF